MVDWDLVDKRRAKGWDWDRIAEDPKVGFHAEEAAGESRCGRCGPSDYQRRSKAEGRRDSDRPDRNGENGGADAPIPSSR